MARRNDGPDLADEQGDDETADDGVSDGPRSKPARTGARGGSRPSPVDGSGHSEVTSKWAIDRLDERERQFSFIAAGGAVLFGVILYVVETENSKFRLHKGQFTPQTALIVGLVAGGLLFGATLLGRRAPIGFLALFTGLLFSNASNSLILALPFLVLAIWILYHSYKIQKETSAKLRAARAESRASRRPAPARSGTLSAKTGTGSTKKGRASGSSRPEGNKRYTPKRPPPPAPKPSRRERKATRASD